MPTLEQEKTQRQHHIPRGEEGVMLTSDPSSPTFSSRKQFSLLTSGSGGAGEGGAQHQG